MIFKYVKSFASFSTSTKFVFYWQIIQSLINIQMLWLRSLWVLRRSLCRQAGPGPHSLGLWLVRSGHTGLWLAGPGRDLAKALSESCDWREGGTRPNQAQQHREHETGHTGRAQQHQEHQAHPLRKYVSSLDHVYTYALCKIQRIALRNQLSIDSLK